MDFGKIPPACNFIYKQDNHSLLECTESTYANALEALGGDLYRYRITSGKWEQKSQAKLDTVAFQNAPSESEATLSASGELHFMFQGHTLLRSLPERAFGVLGKKWLLGFEHSETMHLYGLGDKNNGFEKSGKITKFWNTDTMADFGPIRVQHEPTDPFYATIPYLLIHQPWGCIGILLNNPMPSFMNLGAKEHIANLADAKDNERPILTIGAYGGMPEFYFIVGEDVREVTRKMMRLSGMTPLPPLWAIGYQQCRWGYRDLEDLEELDQKFDELEIPCDGLWLDIDYMDAYKVFTVNDSIAADHSARIQTLQAKGRKIVPIIDPGVKYLPGYDIFESGLASGAFCQTEEGNIYSGFVWPGRTAFPDFSMPEAREWWATQVHRFTETYQFDGYWLDMNDPSTGSAELEDMRFNQGKDEHASYHNQYAFGMQQATVEGVRRARPEKRPFLISRSGYTSSSRYSAIWTGDNWSNYFHLKASIACTLNLSLSGIPFNGPDVPGFEGEASPELAVDWHKAGFLFPFFRNHSALASPRQEPWQYDAPYRDVIIHYIRLRYKLLPYLYQLFQAQAELGDPLLRPVFYEFPEEQARFAEIDDHFMVGPAILQAPQVEASARSHRVLLPGCAWLDTGNGAWLEEAPCLTIQSTRQSTPLYFREGTLIPMFPGIQTTATKDLSRVEIHVIKRKGDESTSTLEYCFDDGETVHAPQSRVAFQVRSEGETLYVKVVNSSFDFQPLQVRFVGYDAFKDLVLDWDGKKSSLPFTSNSITFTGEAIGCIETEWIQLS